MSTLSVLAQFNVTLSVAVAEPVQVEWHTSDGTAKATVDYAAASGTVIFAPGETSKFIDILVYGRATGAEDRSFFVEMLPPTNAILGASIGECIIHVDTSGSTPVTQIIVPTGPKGPEGDSAYQSYLNTTTDNPPMTEAEWVESLKGDPAEIAQEVAPLIDVGATVLTAEGTESLGHPDSTTVKAVARRVAYAAACKIATVALADGENTLVTADLTGDDVKFEGAGFYPRILRSGMIISPDWSLNIDGSIVVYGAVAGDVLYALQYDFVSDYNSRDSILSVTEPSFYAKHKSFESGSDEIKSSKDALLWLGAPPGEGPYYVWDGGLPKPVPQGSTPETTGGVGLGAWVSVGDATLRSMLATSSGAGLIGTTSGGNVQEELNEINTRKIVGSISELVALNTADTEIVTVIGFHEGSVASLNSGVGGGIFKWSATTSKTAHNGGTVIDPDKAFPATWDAAGKNSWFTAATSGSGCWLRVRDYDCLLAEFFGAVPWRPGDTYDSTIEFQKTADVAGRGGVWRWKGRHRTTSYILTPEKQTFGSFGQMTSVSSELFDVTNFQGVHTSPYPDIADKIDSALFYDADTGEAFRCMEGAIPNNFLLYGKGYNTLGISVSPVLPHSDKYYNTSGIRHGKYIKPENVTVILFSRAFDSNPWSTGGSYVGDYYSTFTNCEVMWCNCIRRVTTTVPYNTKFVNLRAVVNRIGDFGVAVRNLVFIGGSIESFNESTTLRADSNISLSSGVYMETYDPAFNGKVFDVVGFCSFHIDSARIFLNCITEFISSGGSGQSTAVGTVSFTGLGNVWTRSDGGSGSVYSAALVPTKTVGLFGDLIKVSNGSSVNFFTGTAPAVGYAPPVVINA